MSKKKPTEKELNDKKVENNEENVQAKAEETTDTVEETKVEADKEAESKKVSEAKETQKEESPKNETPEEAPLSELEQAQVDLAATKDKYLRLSAEFDNYRKRTLKEKMEMIKSAGGDILSALLPIVDNFDRALKAMETATDPEATKEGIQLIYNNFKGFLNQRDLKEIEAIGEPFDTDKHEALTKIPAPTPDMKGKVVDVIEKGYTLGDKVVRYAKVVVGD